MVQATEKMAQRNMRDIGKKINILVMELNFLKMGRQFLTKGGSQKVSTLVRGRSIIAKM